LNAQLFHADSMNLAVLPRSALFAKTNAFFAL
jgi:hypothetical protein